MALPNEIHPFAIAGGGNQYQVANSLRFRKSNSASLSRTSSTSTSTTTFTASLWIKRGALNGGTAQRLMCFPDGSSAAGFNLYYDIPGDGYGTEDSIGVALTIGASSYFWNTSPVYRDPSAWYHVVVTVDTTQATSTNRVKVYVNGSLISGSWYVTPGAVPQNSSVANMNSSTWAIGRYSTTRYFDGYMAEVNFIDGQALDPTYFGQTDSITNQWVPKKYTGSYGTNGFYLPFNKSTVSGENDAYTAFLAHFNSFNDTSNSGKSITTYGTAAISSAQAKFGTGSLYVNAASQTSGNAYIRTASSSDFNIGAVSGNTNDFTFEFWYYVPNATNAWPYYPVLAISDSTYSPFLLLAGSFYSSSNGSSWDIASGKSAGTPTPSAWNHYAFVRSGNTWYIFLNGVQQDTWTSNSTPQALSSYLQIGRIQGGSAYTNGYFDEVRWSKGVARYTANFTVPSGPFTGGIGYDAANDCHWTPSGISVTSGSTYDVMIDSPTAYNDGGNNRGNYCIINPLSGAATQPGTVSDGNLKHTGVYDGNAGGYFGSILVSSGKWYFEVEPISNGGYGGTFVGIYTNFGSTGYWAGTTETYTTYGVYGVAFDADAQKFWIRLASTGNWASGDPALGTSPSTTFTTGTGVRPYCINERSSGYQNSGIGVWNFGQRPFTYTPPSGFLALNSYNLANPSLPLV